MNFFNKNNLKKIAVVLLVVFFLSSFVGVVNAGGGTGGGEGNCECTGPQPECAGNNWGNSPYQDYCIVTPTNCESGETPYIDLADGYEFCNCICSQEVCTCEDNDNDGYYEGGCSIMGYTSCTLDNDGDCDGDTSDDPLGCPTSTWDCDESTSTCAICIHPGATEICTNGVDDDCDGDKDTDDSECEGHVGMCPGGCACYDSNTCSNYYTIWGGICTGDQGVTCLSGTTCQYGMCVHKTCSYGLSLFECDCNGQIVNEGEYCCQFGPSSDPCPDSKWVEYKWNPITQELDYCDGSEMGCPQPNPFIWREEYHTSFNFLEGHIDNLFETIPIFNQLYDLSFYHESLTINLINKDIPLGSDNLSDYPLHIKDFTAYGIPDYYFCAQEDGPIGEIPWDKIYDAGTGTGEEEDSLEIYCRNHIIRICLSNEPCYWREPGSINSADDKTCNPPEEYSFTFTLGYPKVYPAFAKNANGFEGMEIPEVAESGTGKFKEVFCKEDYFGYSEGWYGEFMPYESFEFELSENFGHILKGNSIYTLDNEPTYQFCDQDHSDIDCGAPSCNYIGYDPFPEWEQEQSWDEINEQCMGDDYIDSKYYQRDGPVMVPEEGSEDYRPDFLYQTVDEPDFSKSFCEEGPIGANYNYRAWLDVATEPGYCCGDDDGTLYFPYGVDGTLGEPEPLGFNNYNDCSKLVNNQYLCNAPLEGSVAKWEDAAIEGEIVYLPCYPATVGTEFVSNGETWISCGQHSLISSDEPEKSPHQFNGPSFSSQEQRVGQNYKHSYLCQDTVAITGENSITECCGDTCYSGTQTDAGERENTGGWKETINGDRYYCAINSDKNSAETITSTASTESTLWTQDIDLTNSDTCTEAGYQWTGKIPYHTFALYSDFSSHENFCCGDYDDTQSFTNGISKLLYESYNDPGGLGVCFNATFQIDNQQINHNNKEYNETFVIGGTIKGCAIDKESAISSSQCSGELGSCTPGIPYTNNKYSDSSKPFKANKWLSELYDWPDPGHFNNIDLETVPPLVQDNKYCSIISVEESNYFCDYTEDWKLAEEESPTHLSFVEWETEGQKASCCLPEQCWSGESCIGDESQNAMLPTYGEGEEQYRCIMGSWQPANLKYTWDKEQSGYCQYNDQCLVNPSGTQGNPDNPQCISSNNFIGDHFCEEGNWTTRTKFIALQLLDIPSSNQPYTLYCDSYQNTLNKYDYNDLESFILYPRTMNGSTFSSVNNFCILRYGEDDKIVIATSLNHNLLEPTASFLTTFEQEVDFCPTGHQGFGSCQSSPDYVYYNEEINSIIYSKHPLQLNSPFNNFLDFFQDIFETIISFFTSGPVPGHSMYEFIEQTSDFDQIYISNQEQVVAIKERVWPTQEHISIQYNGLGANVCETVEVYDTKLGSTNSIDCEENNGIYYVASTLPEGINIWSLTTAKLRPQIAK